MTAPRFRRTTAAALAAPGVCSWERRDGQSCGRRRTHVVGFVFVFASVCGVHRRVAERDGWQTVDEVAS